MKIKNIKNKEGRNYVRVWIKLLNVMLNWTEEQTLKWADKWGDGLNDDVMMFYNNTPCYYITELLIPKSVQDGLSTYENMLLNSTLMSVIEDGNCFFDRNPAYDWKLAKQRVDAFINKVEQRKNKSKDALISYLKYKIEYHSMRLRNPEIEKQLQQIFNEAGGVKRHKKRELKIVQGSKSRGSKKQTG